jgi:hypothetical protein
LYKLPLVSKLPRSSCTIISAWLNCYTKYEKNYVEFDKAVDIGNIRFYNVYMR